MHLDFFYFLILFSFELGLHSPPIHTHTLKLTFTMEMVVESTAAHNYITLSLLA